MPKEKTAKAATKAVKMAALTAKDLNAASQSLFSAVQRGNIAAVAPALAPDFSFIDERGTVSLRANCVASIQSMVSNPPPDLQKLGLGPVDTKLKVSSFKVGEVQSRTVGTTVIQTMLYTDNVAVDRLRAKTKSSFSRSFRWTNVWVKGAEGYQLAFTQLTPVQ